MSQFSQERVQWIEERLFCLARMVGQLKTEGMRLAVGHQMATTSGDAMTIVNQALMAIQAERLQLMAERAVIEDYHRDRLQDGS